MTVDLPTAAAVTIQPAATSTAPTMPTFSWQGVPDADFYVAEVRDVLGQNLWGGFDQRRRPTMRILDSATSITFGDLTPPRRALVAGGAYTWRLYACEDTNTGMQYAIIGASEVRAGAFRAR